MIPASIARGTGPLRVLVVDDDAVDRMAVQRTLQKSGLADALVHEVADADDALRALAADGDAGAFDCVLLDYELAGDTGLDVLRRMGVLGHVVPVVVLTGRSDPETAAALIRAGAADFLTKGALTPERLEQSIRGALRIARAEYALHESRERLATTLHSIADAVVVLDLAGSVTYLNPAAERLTGWTVGEATGRRLDEVASVVSVDDEGTALREALLYEGVRRVLGGDRADDRLDMALVARDGTQRFVDATASPLRDASGVTTGAVIALRDITERKAAEAALSAAHDRLQHQAADLEQQAEELSQQYEEAQSLTAELEQANEHLQEANVQAERSEGRYRALVEASAQLIWSTDADGRALNVPGWQALTGQESAQVMGDGWLDAVHPDDRARSRAAWEGAFMAKQPYEADYRLRMADGGWRWHRARGVPLVDADGAIAEWVGTLSDIDDERRAAEAQRGEVDLVETLHRIGGVLSSELDDARIVQTVTDATTALTGAQFGTFSPTPPGTAPALPATPIVRSDDITQDARYGPLQPPPGLPGGGRPVRSYLAVPVITRNGEVIGVLSFGHEDAGVFTPRAERLVWGIAASAAVAMDNARLYQAERRARAEAEGANKAKAEFLASMSHELRTPLNAIGGYADLVLEGIRGPVTELQRADLIRIKKSQHHLLSLINDILNFAKIEAGRVRFDLKDVSMNEALGGLEALVAPQLLEKGLSYDYQCCDPSYRAHVDPERLQQILLNLLSNAVKFTPPGGKVLVQCASTRERMVVRVSDTGVGIPPDRLEQVFEPFIQLERGQSTKSPGTGLGLAISRDLARAMNGELTAVSAIDRGSTFILTLPLATGPETPAPPAIPAPS